MKTEQIGVHAEAIPASRHLVALPSMNPSLGPTLIVTGFFHQGYSLELLDAAGALIWARMLNAEDGVNGPDFGSESSTD